MPARGWHRNTYTHGCSVIDRKLVLLIANRRVLLLTPGFFFDYRRRLASDCHPQLASKKGTGKNGDGQPGEEGGASLLCSFLRVATTGWPRRIRECARHDDWRTMARRRSRAAALGFGPHERGRHRTRCWAQHRAESTRGDPRDALAPTVWAEASWFAHNVSFVARERPTPRTDDQGSLIDEDGDSLISTRCDFCTPGRARG